jgi:hypothetical protein
MNANQIPQAPTYRPMFEDPGQFERPTLATYLRGITFHPDDVPEFGLFEAAELFREILVGDFDWTVRDQTTVEWVSESISFRVSVGAFGSVDVEEIEGNHVERSTTFRGGYRVSVQRALQFLATLQAA